MDSPVAWANRAVRLARLTTLPTRSELTLATNSLRFRSRSSVRGTEFRGVVVAQIGRVEVFQVGRCRDERALALGHLFAADGQETVNVDLGRQIETGGFQHAGPEQRVKIGDVLADEVMDFGLRITPPRLKVLARPLDTTAGSKPGSRSGRQTRRTSSCPGLSGISKPKYGAGREISQSRNCLRPSGPCASPRKCPFR